MTQRLRILVVGGAISYRALFNWMRPSIYIPTLLLGPLFQIVFFAYLGRYTGVRDERWFVIGNGIQICSMACIYGSAMAIGNERYFATLGALLATPAPRAPLFLGRALPFLANGVLVSVFGLVAGSLLLGVHVAPGSIPAIGLVLVVSAASCTVLGLTIGSVGMRLRDVLFGANIAYVAMQLFCGVNVPRTALPPWMRAVGDVLPLTHGIEAARGLAAGLPLSAVSGLVWREALVGAGWAVAGYALFRLFETEGRRSATLDTL